jgi:hypothetical protein
VTLWHFGVWNTKPPSYLNVSSTSEHRITPIDWRSPFPMQFRDLWFLGIKRGSSTLALLNHACRLLSSTITEKLALQGGSSGIPLDGYIGFDTGHAEDGEYAEDRDTPHWPRRGRLRHWPRPPRPQAQPLADGSRAERLRHWRRRGGECGEYFNLTDHF